MEYKIAPGSLSLDSLQIVFCLASGLKSSENARVNTVIIARHRGLTAFARYGMDRGKEVRGVRKHSKQFFDQL